MLGDLRRLLTPSAPLGLLVLSVAFACAAFAGAAGAWPVGQDDEVILDHFTATSKDGDVITIERADFKGTNLSRDEIAQLLTPGTSSDDETALLQKMKVAELSIPSIEIARKSGGVVHIHDVTGSGIDSGRIGRFGFSGLDGAGVDDDGPWRVKTGALALENADLAEALGAAKDPTRLSQMTRVGHFAWTAVDIAAPEKEAGPDKTIRIALDSIEIHNEYEGASFKESAIILKNLVVEPSKGSDVANSLAPFGYSQVSLSVRFVAHYDSGAKKLSVVDFTIDGANAGAIGLKAEFADIDPALFGSDADARATALAAGAITAIEFKFVNAGIFEKALAYFAAQQKTTPESVRQQWIAAAGLMLPALLGGGPAALKVAAEAQKFVAAPANLTIAVRPKSGTFKFSDAAGIGDPTTLIGGLDIAATANK
ncbi:MAG: hypothetical protein ABSG83_04875 [Roseiarcus sp.]|jgi:hypothetical protein